MDRRVLGNWHALCGGKAGDNLKGLPIANFNGIQKRPILQ